MGGLGDHLRELRLKKGWSQREAARRLSISYTRLSEIEQGISRSTNKPTTPGTEFLIKASKGYGVPLSTMLEMAGLAGEDIDKHQEAELIEAWRGLSPESRSMAIAILRAMGAQEANTL